jgi:hypothetical membrane protein
MAVGWVLSVNFYVVQILAAAAWRTPYSLARDAISDLGAVHCGMREPSGYLCSPWHAAMNLSFVATGLLIAAGAFRLAVPDVASTVLIALGGAGSILVGIFPSDVSIVPHMLGAFLVFIAGNLGMLLYARHHRYPSVVILTALGLVGAVVLIAVLPAVAAAAKPFGGAVERVAAYPFSLAAMICGVSYLRAVRQRRPPA